jgi:hypothetical protein
MATKRDDSIQGYFRRILKKNPRLLNGKTNQELLNRWLTDHPGETEVPDRVKQGLSNLKSVLRRQAREKASPPPEAPATFEPRHELAPEVPNPLEALEEQIDECLMIARTLDREGLASVISLLRQARNEVVWKMGE